MATLQEVLFKVQSGSATASDFEELAKLSKAEADSKKKIEATAKELIESIKNAKVDPKTLTNLLAKEGLIILPTVQTQQAKTVIIEEPVTTKEGRSSTFKVWAGRDCVALAGDAKSYWTALKGKGFDYFIANLNAEGKKYYETEEGKKYINSLFGK